MKVGIVGSRHFHNYKKFKKYLKKILKENKIKITKISKIVSGGCRGVDSLAEKYANKKNILVKIYNPNWKKYGKIAGLIRNKKIVKKSDIIIAFPTTDSRGTYHTINLAKQAKKKVYIKTIKN